MPELMELHHRNIHLLVHHWNLLTDNYLNSGSELSATFPTKVTLIQNTYHYRRCNIPCVCLIPGEFQRNSNEIFKQPTHERFIVVGASILNLVCMNMTAY